MRRQIALGIIVPVALLVAACTVNGDADPVDEDSSAGGAMSVMAGEPLPDERCAANEAAGTIDYFTGFDYAAAASILEVIVADERGYYDDLCLDVVITPGASTTNYALVAANEAQFASAGSFSELASFAEANEAGVGMDTD